jgi:hypothetical protein
MQERDILTGVNISGKRKMQFVSSENYRMCDIHVRANNTYYTTLSCHLMKSGI